MDKKEEQSTITKLTAKEKSILINIDKSSKWEDVKSIEAINQEINNLEIYRDFIGLGCSKYLNESGEKGEIDVEEMFRNCREAEKVRQRVKKKEIREERKGIKAGKAGLLRGNIGEKKQIIKEIPSKQIKSNPIVDKAKEIGEQIKEALTRSSKGDDWKASIAKLGLRLGLDTLFGVIIGVMDYSFKNPSQGIAIGSGALTLIGSIYAYISQTETGKAIIENTKNWIRGKINELINYLTGNGINVIRRRPRRRTDMGRGAGGRGDDDDDDSDSGGDEFFYDADELNSYGSEEERQEQQQQQQQQEQQQERPQLTPAESMLMGIIRNSERNRTINDMNTSTTRMFQENPLPTATQTYTQPETIIDRRPSTSESLNTNLSIGRNLMGIGAGLITGASMVRNYFSDGGATQMRDVGGDVPDMVIDDGGEFFDAQPPPQSGNLFSAFNAPRLADNDLPTNINPRGRIEARYDLQRNPLTDQETIDNQNEELRRRQETINDLNNRLTDEEIRNQELNARINDEIDNMDLHGRSWGLFFGGNNGGSKTAQEGLTNLVFNPQERADQVYNLMTMSREDIDAPMGTQELLSSIRTEIRPNILQRVEEERQQAIQTGDTLSRIRTDALSNVRARVAEETQQGLMEDLARQRQESVMTQERINMENQMIREKLEQSLMKGEDRKPTPAEMEIIQEQKRLLEQKDASIEKLMEEKTEAQEAFMGMVRQQAQERERIMEKQKDIEQPDIIADDPKKKSPPREPERPAPPRQPESMMSVARASEARPEPEGAMRASAVEGQGRTIKPFVRLKGKASTRRNVLSFFGRDPDEKSTNIENLYRDVLRNDRELSERQLSKLAEIFGLIRQLHRENFRSGRYYPNLLKEDYHMIMDAIDSFK